MTSPHPTLRCPHTHTTPPQPTPTHPTPTPQNKKKKSGHGKGIGCLYYAVEDFGIQLLALKNNPEDKRCRWRTRPCPAVTWHTKNGFQGNGCLGSNLKLKNKFYIQARIMQSFTSTGTASSKGISKPGRKRAHLTSTELDGSYEYVDH